jgi:purine-cytosine permease-like protein
MKVTLQSLGAAAAIASTDVASWGEGYQGGNVGGLLAAMLSPTGRFGKFLTVLLSLSVAGNIAANFYSFCLNVQVFVPFLVVVPRYIFSIVATVMSVLFSSHDRPTMLTSALLVSFHYPSWVLTDSTTLSKIFWASSDTGLGHTLGSS